MKNRQSKGKTEAGGQAINLAEEKARFLSLVWAPSMKESFPISKQDNQ